MDTRLPSPPCLRVRRSERLDRNRDLGGAPGRAAASGLYVPPVDSNLGPTGRRGRQYRACLRDPGSSPVTPADLRKRVEAAMPEPWVATPPTPDDNWTIGNDDDLICEL